MSVTRYHVRLDVDLPNDEDDQPAYTARQIEKHLLVVLRKVDGDVTDLEVMGTELLTDDGELVTL